MKKRAAPVVPPEPVAAGPEDWWPMVEVAQTGLYVDNPFRVLGLRVFAAPGEIARRVDEVASGAARGTWAFAPGGRLDPTRVHEAAQTLKGGLGRLFAEFFWFWPENYPEEKSDPAIEALARGDMETACDYWEEMLATRRGVAAHNLAVLFHLIALDKEAARSALDAEVAGWWSVATEHWNLALGDDEVWARLESRLKRFDDPRVPADFARRVREALPRALVRIHVRAALTRAEQGNWAEAATLAELLAKSGAPVATLREPLEAGLGALLGGLGPVLDEVARRIALDAQPCLPIVQDLLRRTAGQRRVAQVLADLGSEPGRLLANRVVETAVTGVIEHRRRTRAHSAVLPWLVHLATLPAPPDVVTRVLEARNAALVDVMTARNDGPTETDPASRMESGLRVLSEVLVPAPAAIDWWDSATRAAFLAHTSTLLRELAQDAFEALDDFDLPSRAFALATTISGPEQRMAIAEDRRKLWRQFLSRHKEGMRVEHAGHVLEIDAQQLVFDGDAIAVDLITRVRYGSNPPGTSPGFRVAWCGVNEVVELDSLNLLLPDEDTEAIYRLIVDTIEAYVVPGLVTRIVGKVRSGESVVLGPAALRPEGFVMSRRAGRGGGVSPAIPYSRLRCTVDRGELVVAKADDASTAVRCALGEVWNGVVIEQVIAELARGK